MDRNTIDRIVEAFKRIETEEDYIYIARLVDAKEIEEYVSNLGYKIDEKNVKKQLVKKMFNELTEEDKKYFLDKVIEEQDAKLIASLEDEQLKIDAIDRFKHDRRKAIIISSLEDDQKKVELLGKIKRSEYAKSDVIKTIKDDDLKEDMLSTIKDVDCRDDIITSFNSDDIKYLYVITNKVQTPSYIIKSMKDDEMKLELLDYLNSLKAVINVLKTLESDDIKIEYINQLRKSEDKAELTKTLKDDEKKIEQLKNIQDEYYRAEVIATIEEDKKRKELLETINLKGNRNAIIKNFTDIDVINEIPECKPNDLKRIKESKKDKEQVKSEVLKECDIKYKEIGLDKKLTYGIEIEAEGIFYKVLKKQRFMLENWKIKEESSLVGTGLEVVSPIMSDRKEDIEDLYCVNKMLENSKFEATDDCAAHVHFGADYLSKFDSYVNLFELYGNTERILFQISNGHGKITRKDAEVYARPISKDLEKALKEGIIGGGVKKANEFIETVKKEVARNRMTGMNVMNINGGKNTIEFRMANGTLDTNEWIENVKLYGRLIQKSEELMMVQQKPDKTKEEIDELQKFEDLKKDIPEEEKAEILFDLLFDENEREVYQERYAENHKICEEVDFFNKNKFGIVDFKREYLSQVQKGKKLTDIGKNIISELDEKSKNKETNEERISE